MSMSILSRYCFLTCILSIIVICAYGLLHIILKTMDDHLFEAPLLNTSNGNIKQSSLLSLLNGHMPRELCNLSWIESDGWYCEFDDDWNRRKRIHRLQNRRNRYNDARSDFFQNNWEPTFHCPFEQRIGKSGDGGKWVCDIHKLETDDKVPLIYSLGSSGNFVFEQGIRELLPKAEIHTVDSRNYGCPIDGCTFHKAFISDGMTLGTKSLNMLIDQLGHRQREIDILKIDIEGSEFTALEAFFKHSSNTTTSNDDKDDNNNRLPYIRQILVEIHLQHDEVSEPIDRVHGLFELLRSNNYAIFHKEPNLYGGTAICEYGFIRLNPAFFVSPFQ